jgi:hypothetical protein
MKDKKTVIEKLKPKEYFYITLLAMFCNELEEERIITPNQRGEISRYMKKKFNRC